MRSMMWTKSLTAVVICRLIVALILNTKSKG